MATPLDHEVARRIHRHGPIGFDEVVELALYDPEHGFYGSGAGAAGRRADFLTSPEVGPLFGAVLARALDSWWIELGRPDPFTVIEAAAGTGTLARSVLFAEPACAPALTSVLVERSAPLRRRQGEHLPLVEPALAFPPGDVERPGAREDAAGLGPRVVSLPDLPAVAVTGVVLANELLDNLPFRLLECRVDGWFEVRVGLVDGSSADQPRLGEVLVPATDADVGLAERLAPAAPPGARIPLQSAAAAWVGAALDVIDQGRLVVIDYASTTSALALRPSDQWVRTYRGHERGGPALDGLGTQDITCEVDEAQLALGRPPTGRSDQASFLAGHGLGELVHEGRRIWQERAHIGDLTALRARSRIGESEALTDPTGLGAFHVLEWTVAERR
jgi:SAM-dependent MidA family methyltransferase